MFKKTLISLAVASSLGLTGCFDSGETGANANPDYQVTDTTIDRSLVRPVYNPNPLAGDSAAFPINSDLILLLGASQSANYDFTGLSTGKTPADDAVNRLSGFSTSGAFSLMFDGSLNPESVQANATVFLIPLNVAPAVPGAEGALPNTNPGSIVAANPFGQGLGLVQPNFRAKAISLDGGTNNAIRIVPLEPLEDGQKYLVVVTNDVVGANNKPIARSVQDLALADGVLGNPALGSVKTLLTTSDALANGFLANMSIDAKSALAYTFTTNADSDVLRAMMAPAAFGTALGQKIGFTAQLKAVRDAYPDLNFSELSGQLSELGEKGAALANGDISPSDLTAQELTALAALQNAQAKTKPADIQAAIGSQVANGNMHFPVPRPSFFYKFTDASTLATIQGLNAAAQAKNETNPIVEAAKQVKVSQGAIALPYFQSLPGEDGAGITKGSWLGNTSLEAGLNESLAPGEKIFSFLRDIDGQLNVNGYFPFPQQNATTTVPIVVFRPTLDGTPAQPASCGQAGSNGTLKGVTVFQHGITVDRSVSMLPAILLAQATCQAVIAIDQPLHGLAGPTVGTVPGLTPLDGTELTTAVNTAIANTGGDNSPLKDVLIPLIQADYIGERHFGYTANEALQPVEAPLAEIKSGSLFINPLNMMNSRDNLRQGVVDLTNVVASIPTFDVNGDFAPGDLKGLPVNFIGHSLGGISGTTFASLMNDPTLNGTVNAMYQSAGAPLSNFTFPKLSSVVLHNTSGQVTRLIENSPAFSGVLLNGLASEGVTQGSSDFENFFYVFQSIVDSSDPVNFAKGFGKSTSNILITEVTGDNTVPNEANANPLGKALPAPLTGTEPLMALIDLGAGGSKLADGSEGLHIIDLNSSTGAAMPVATFFDGTNPCSDANHSTFVVPSAPSENCPGGATDTSVAFSAMITQTAQAISGQAIPGAGVLTPDTIGGSLGSSTTIEQALDQNK